MKASAASEQEDGVGVKRPPQNAMGHYIKAISHSSITEYSLERAEAGIERIKA